MIGFVKEDLKHDFFCNSFANSNNTMKHTIVTCLLRSGPSDRMGNKNTDWTLKSVIFATLIEYNLM